MLKKNKEKQERDACTFQPKILKYKKQDMSTSSQQERDGNSEIIERAEKTRKQHVKVSTAEPTADRCKILYDLSKKIVKREDKSTDLYKFEKESKEYTFSPDLKKEDAKSVSVSAGLVDKTIERMKKAREERERVKKALGRGSDDSGMRFGMQKTKFGGSFQQFAGQEKSREQSGELSKNVNEMQGENKEEPEQFQAPFSTEISPQPTRTMEEETSQRASNMPKQVSESRTDEEKPLQQPETKEALLFIDVNLGTKQKRIVVYKGDTAAELAEIFAKENGIIA